MKITSLNSCVAAFVMFFVTSVQAEIKLPAIVSSNMVLQRNATIQIWGWFDPKENISIETSWINGPLKVKANYEGNWRIEIKTTYSKAPPYHYNKRQELRHHLRKYPFWGSEAVFGAIEYANAIKGV